LLISEEIIIMMASKKRRVIKDDDDEGNDENEFDADGGDDGGTSTAVKLEVNQKQQQAQAENDKRNFATSMVDRLKRRAAKTKAVAQEKSTIKRMKVETTTAEATPTSVATIKKEQSIPKKPKRITQTQTLTIPKKSNDDAKIESNNAPNDKIKKEATTTTPSLLSTMKKPPTSSNKSKNNKSFPPPTSRGRSTSPPRSNVVNLTRSPGPESVDDDKNGVDVVKKEVVEEKDKLGSGLRQMVWDGLRDTCKTIFPIPPIRDGIDLQASFLRHKDLNISTNIDTISSSNSNNQRYDFFDIDETNGNIVMQTKIPIFPEDFPPGVKEWPLSWWGIVDPSIGERRVEVKSEQNNKIDIKKEQHTKPKRETTPVAKKSTDQPKGDKNRHDNTNTNSNNNRSDSSGRKRSSRDRHEDEPFYYDDYHHRGNGGGGGCSGGNPPPFHGNNFRNHPHDRGGAGGPPFPNRMGDGPHTNNNNNPRYGPPTGDFRGGGGGGRPHHTHGGGGGGGPPRNYPPQGGRRPDERRGRR
jgi:hypothetical protein